MPWYQDVPDSVMPVTCEGHQHQIIWSAGKVKLVDHPQIDAERTLVALGGTKPRCLELLELWDLAVKDGGFIEEWAPWQKADSQRRWWLGTAIERLRSEGVQDFLFDLPRDRALQMGEFSTAVPHAFLDRAMATVVDDGYQRGWDFNPSLTRHLAEATKLRARRSFVAALASQRPSIPNPALVPFSCTVDLTLKPKIIGRLSGRASKIEITLHPKWLSDVWARGVSVFQDKFTLDVNEAGDKTTLTQVEWIPERRSLTPHIVTHQL